MSYLSDFLMSSWFSLKHFRIFKFFSKIEFLLGNLQNFWVGKLNKQKNIKSYFWDFLFGPNLIGHILAPFLDDQVLGPYANGDIPPRKRSCWNFLKGYFEEKVANSLKIIKIFKIFSLLRGGLGFFSWVTWHWVTQMPQKQIFFENIKICHTHIVRALRLFQRLLRVFDAWTCALPAPPHVVSGGGASSEAPEASTSAGAGSAGDGAARRRRFRRCFSISGHLRLGQLGKLRVRWNFFAKVNPKNCT